MGHETLQVRLTEARSHAQKNNPAAACEILRELLPQSEDVDIQRAAAIGLIRLNSYSDFSRAVEVLAEGFGDTADQQHLDAYSYGCFALGDAEESIRSARAAIVRNPANWPAMKILGMANLLAANPLDAFLAFSAASLVSGSADMMQLKLLASKLMAGQDHHAFVFDGETYKFHLRTDTSQMIEAALSHHQGVLTEPAELRAIGQFVKTGHTIIEIGTLVGNHLIYFLKTLRPRKAIVIDFDARSIEATRANARLNEPFPSNPEIVFHQVGISGARGQSSGPDGRPIDVVPLDEIVAEPVDFIKIDADGLELDVLSGAATLISDHRPMIMIEIARLNEEGFRDALDKIRYRIVGTVDRLDYKNYLIEPTERRS